MHLLEVRGLGIRNPETGTEWILKDVGFEVGEGEFVTIMGPSGSGKTTLLHLCAGLESPSEGSVFLAGKDLAAMKDRDRTLLRRKWIGFVFQFFHLLPDLTVRENLELPLRLQGEDPAVHEGRIEEILDALELGDLRDRQPHGLSGGEMQRASIARALAGRPPLVLADEPTGNLASRAGEETMRLFREVHRRFGTSILLVTHNPRDAAFGDRVLFLFDGRLDPAHALEGPDLDAASVFARLEELGI